MAGLATIAPTSVLLVEDASTTRSNLKKLLTGGHFAVTAEAGTGEAVAVARAKQPEVILVSLEEPIIRPLKCVEALSAALPRTPVVVVSSLADREHFRRAMLAGARDFLTIPLSAEEIDRELTTVVESEQKRQALSQDAVETGHRGEVVAVFAGKGGVGKTTLATNLAVAMALEASQTSKQRVALVDLDVFFGDVAIMLDVTPERTLSDVMAVADRLDPELLRGFLQPHSSGLKVLCAPTRAEEGERITPERVRRVLDVLTRTFDHVVLDLPRALDDRVVTALDAASLVLLLTTYEVPCLKSTRVCLDTLRSWRYSEDKLKLVINHANRTNGFSAGEAAGALDYPVFWKLPSDATVAATSNHGKPFVQAQPTAKLAQNLVALSATLSGANRNGRGNLFARLLERGLPSL